MTSYQTPQTPQWESAPHRRKTHKVRNTLLAAAGVLVVVIVAAAIAGGGGKKNTPAAGVGSTPAANHSAAAPTPQQQLITKLENTTASDGNSLYSDLQSAGLNPVTLANSLCSGSGSISVPSSWDQSDNKAFDNAVSSTMCPGRTIAPRYTEAQQSAIQDAENYLQSEPGFSKLGLIGQLEYDKFSAALAAFAVNHITVNWDQQAADDARNYMTSEGGFSYGGMVSQLEYDKFTPAQAAYGAKAAGL